MCDDEIHQGVSQDPRISRRAFAAATMATSVLAGAAAHAKTEIAEKDVEVKTADGSADAVLLHPSGAGSWPAVLIWTDILGLRPVFRQMGRRLAEQGYVVLVPNPFYRQKRAPVVEGAFDFAKPEDRAKVMPLAAALTPDGTQRDAVAFQTFLDAQPQTNSNARAGVHGYCMGGPLTFRTAAALPSRVGAAATFHGGNLVTAKPDSPHLLVARTKAEFYCAVAENDDKRDPSAKDALKATFAKARIAARVEVYAGANHGWCVAGSAAYNEAAAERAWAELLALYTRTLV